MQSRNSNGNEPPGVMRDRRNLPKTASAAAIVLMMGIPTAGPAQSAPPATGPEDAAALSREAAEFAAARREGIFALSPFAEASPDDGVEKLKEIPELVSSNGRLDVDLTVSEEKHTIKTKQKEYPLMVRSYVAAGVPEKGMWAPTLRVKPNDRLTLTIHNRLPPDSPLPAPDCNHPPKHGDHNFPHAFNVTNMHTHGLHVSPYEDDIFREVPPSFSSRYTYELGNHPPGTHWYHPHVHGSTAMQVVNGMAGVLIVEPRTPEFPGVDDQVLIFNQFAFDDNGTPPYRLDTFDHLWTKGASALGTTINGQVKPTIGAVANQVVRWRLVNAGFSSAV